MNQNLKQLQSIINVQFKDEKMLTQALIHRSFLNENKGKDLKSNERYEFLGDSILELWISETLFNLFPNLEEGDLTNLRSLIVCTQNLALIALEIKLGDFIFLSKGEELHGGRQNQTILADTFEALIGAIYLDQGSKSAYKFLKQSLTESISHFSSKKVLKDPKSVFQEIAQAQKGITPNYKTITEFGPDHNKTFEIGVYLGKELIATGTGSSKQRAEEDASIKATKLFNNQV